MGQILRHHNGVARIDAHLLTDIEWVLDADQAAPRSFIAPLAAAVRDQVANGADPETDPDLVAAVRSRDIHPLLRLLEVDALQRLRGWHRLRHGSIRVDAGALSDIRNTLATLTLAVAGESCEDLADELERELGYDDTHAGDLAHELAYVRARLAAGQRCLRCLNCQYLILRDRIDAALDAQGFYGGAYYEAYIAGDRASDPERTWADIVVAPSRTLRVA